MKYKVLIPLIIIALMLIPVISCTDELISKEDAMDIGGGTEAYLVDIVPDSPMFSIEPTENPCWIVSVYQEWYDPETNRTFTWNVDIVVVDAVTGEVLGHGVPLE